MPLSGPNLDQPMNVFTFLEPALERKPEEIAIASLDRQLTWRELEEAIDALARGLLAFGLKPGERVASLMPNRADLLVHYLSLSLILFT